MVRRGSRLVTAKWRGRNDRRVGLSVKMNFRQENRLEAHGIMAVKSTLRVLRAWDQIKLQLWSGELNVEEGGRGAVWEGGKNRGESVARTLLKINITSCRSSTRWALSRNSLEDELSWPAWGSWWARGSWHKFIPQIETRSVIWTFEVLIRSSLRCCNPREHWDALRVSNLWIKIEIWFLFRGERTRLLFAWRDGPGTSIFYEPRVAGIILQFPIFSDASRCSFSVL